LDAPTSKAGGGIMAGSYKHLVGDNGEFDLECIENMKDAGQALRQLFFMCNYLACGNSQKIEDSIEMYYKLYSDDNEGFMVSPIKEIEASND
jgi:hypothetical protein